MAIRGNFRSTQNYKYTRQTRGVIIYSLNSIYLFSRLDFVGKSSTTPWEKTMQKKTTRGTREERVERPSIECREIFCFLLRRLYGSSLTPPHLRSVSHLAAPVERFNFILFVESDTITPQT